MPRIFLKDIDKGYREAIKKWKQSPQGHVKIGVQGKEALERKKGNIEIDVVSVATFNEFGTPQIPERSFLRHTVDLNEKKISKILSNGVLDVQQKKLNSNQVLQFLGQWAKSEIQKRIRSGIAPANSPQTIARKGSSKPLIDTGQLIQSITYVVEKNNKKE